MLCTQLTSTLAQFIVLDRFDHWSLLTWYSEFECMWKPLNFMAIGIIPWNATPGKACGSTLGDICNTSEVRGCPQSTHIHPNAIQTSAMESREIPSKSPPFVFFNWRIITVACVFPVLPVLSPVHRCVRWGRSHCDRSGKLPLLSLHPFYLVHLCTVCINRSCVECSSSHSHMVYVTTLRKITHRLFLSSNSICCLPSAQMHMAVFILGSMEESAVWAWVLSLIKECDF